MMMMMLALSNHSNRKETRILLRLLLQPPSYSNTTYCLNSMFNKKSFIKYNMLILPSSIWHLIRMHDTWFANFCRSFAPFQSMLRWFATRTLINWRCGAAAAAGNRYNCAIKWIMCKMTMSSNWINHRHHHREGMWCGADDDGRRRPCVWIDESFACTHSLALIEILAFLLLFYLIYGTFLGDMVNRSDSRGGSINDLRN